MNKKITASAPGKLMLFGEHAVVYGHPCLVTAVNQRMHVTIEKMNTDEFYLDAPDVKITNYEKPFSKIGQGEIPKGVQFVEIAVKNFVDTIQERRDEKYGLRVTTRSEFSSQFGFGSSSAATVCVIKALAELLQTDINNKIIFDIAYKTVLDVQGKGSGFDVAAAVFGGTLYFVTGGKKIESLHISSLPLLVGYSGIKADTVTVVNQVKEKFADKKDRVEEIYSTIESIVEEAKAALLSDNLEALGETMNKNQKLLSELGVSIPKLDAMIAGAKSAGAYGAKLSGAGGGDCMIALSPKNKKRNVENAIEKVRGTMIDVLTNTKGVCIES